MDPEIQKQLEEIHALAKDNHRMLRAIRREWWYGIFFKIVFWAILLLAPFYFYQQYLQPYMKQFQVLVPGGATSTGGLFGLPSSAEIQKLLNLP